MDFLAQNLRVVWLSYDDRMTVLWWSYDCLAIIVRSNLVSTIVVQLSQIWGPLLHKDQKELSQVSQTKIKVKVKVNLIELMQHSALYNHPTSVSRNRGSNHYLCSVQHVNISQKKKKMHDKLLACNVSKRRWRWCNYITGTLQKFLYSVLWFWPEVTPEMHNTSQVQ